MLSFLTRIEGVRSKSPVRYSTYRGTLYRASRPALNSISSAGGTDSGLCPSPSRTCTFTSSPSRTSGTGTAANYGCPAAGKTGTTSNFTDAYFDGFTPQLATAVWVGYPKATPTMPGGFGGTLAAPIRHDYIAKASNGY